MVYGDRPPTAPASTVTTQQSSDDIAPDRDSSPRFNRHDTAVVQRYYRTRPSYQASQSATIAASHSFPLALRNLHADLAQASV